MLQSASLPHARQLSALAPAVVQTGLSETQFASLVHSTQEPKRALSSFVSQTGVAPLHPCAWPSSLAEHARQYVTVPLQTGGPEAPAGAPVVQRRSTSLVPRIQALA
jgi:hypothetical protein